MSGHIDAYTHHPAPPGEVIWSDRNGTWRLVVLGSYSITADTSDRLDEEQP